MTTLIAAHIDDLTDEQILALPEDAVELLIKRRMAEEGIPVVPMPVESDYIPVSGPSSAVYEIAGVKFIDRDAAEAVLNVINSHTSQRVKATYGRSYRTTFVESDDADLSVTTRQHYSQESYAAEQDAITENERRREVYEREMRDYRQADEKARHIREDINQRIAEVRQLQERMQTLTERLAEYKVLAQGDEKMAMQFLARAYEVTAAEARELRGGELVEAVSDDA